jgi:hypothetical protein
MDDEIVKILKKHGCGFMADDYKEIFSEIETLLKEKYSKQSSIT